MLKKKLVIALLLFAVYGKSQSLIRSTDNITPDITLNKIIFNESRVKGNKYLYHNWTVGNLITKNNVLSEKKEMIYDLQSDNILVINNSVKNEERNQGIIVETNDILGFVLYDLEGKPHRFVWGGGNLRSVSYTHLRAHETDSYLVCRLLLEKNFFNDTATTEIYTSLFVGSVRCV